MAEPQSEAIPAPTKTEAARRICEETACMEVIDKSETFCPKHKPTPMLHESLKRVGAQYQREGYEVSITTAHGSKKFSVLGTIAKLVDREVYEQAAVRDDNDDAYTIKFVNVTSDGAPICTLYAVKKEASKEEETEEQWPSPWMDRALKSIEKTTTQEDCVKVALPLIDKASTEEEVARLKEVFEAHKAKLPHAENVRSPRPTTADNLLAVLLKCNYVAKGKEHLDAYKKKAPLSEHEELQKTYDAWRKSKPASTPYNRKNKPQAPAPKRKKGKNEEPIRGTIKKKAVKR